MLQLWLEKLNLIPPAPALPQMDGVTEDDLCLDEEGDRFADSFFAQAPALGNAGDEGFFHDVQEVPVPAPPSRRKARVSQTAGVSNTEKMVERWMVQEGNLWGTEFFSPMVALRKAGDKAALRKAGDKGFSD